VGMSDAPGAKSLRSVGAGDRSRVGWLSGTI
jgi:hypothetical protein